MIEEILSSLGIDQTEAKVYFRLLENGSRAAGPLAHDLGIARATLYGILERLKETGLVTESSREAVKIFVAEPPEKVTLLLAERAERLEAHQKLLSGLLPQLQRADSIQLLRPTFQIYEGKTELAQAMKDMLLYSNLETLAFWPIQKMIDALPADLHRAHNTIRIRNKLSIRAIWPRGTVVSLKDYPFLGSRPELLRELRVAPEGVDASMGYWMYGTKVIFLSSRKENIGFVIESAEMVEMLKVHFEVLWKISTPIPDKPDPTALADFLRGL